MKKHVECFMYLPLLYNMKLKETKSDPMCFKFSPDGPFLNK